jgi:hypothetical protein
MPVVPLLPRHRKVQEAAEDARKLNRLLDETSEVTPAARATAGGDRRRLRGIPAVGRGTGGAIAGTSPESALLRKQPRS